jgi:hypothetical protein
MLMRVKVVAVQRNNFVLHLRAREQSETGADLAWVEVGSARSNKTLAPLVKRPAHRVNTYSITEDGKGMSAPGIRTRLAWCDITSHGRDE